MHFASRWRLLLFSVCGCFLLQANAQQLVLPGDHPDPSVVKIGDTYWASATSSNWMPAYPLLSSKDLKSWKLTGHIFSTLPAWADYYFWAPEMTYDNGKVYVYYSAHKKGGNLCVGIASADRPEGPYKDHGPLVCQEVGSIDAFPMRDEKGKLQLIWKEDGNSVNKPTPIWMQELNEERTSLLGEKRELFRNDAPWEGNLVEGVSMIKHGDWFYTFYAAAGCCGNGCTYNSGVARAKQLGGPWEKFAGNPVLKNEGDWKCPGHGTAIEKDGRFYFLYHAYQTTGGVYTGRQGLVKEFTFTTDGWVEFINEVKPQALQSGRREDKFQSTTLNKQWEWNVFQNLKKEVRSGQLLLSALATPTGAFVGQKTFSQAYEVKGLIDHAKSSGAAGVALIGDEKNAVAAFVKGRRIEVVQVKDGKEVIISSRSIIPGRKGFLSMQVKNGKDVSFYYGNKPGKLILLNAQPVDGSYLPPWDRGLRAGLTAKGSIGQKAVFDEFEIEEKK
jgi:beta-xylosidase